MMLSPTEPTEKFPRPETDTGPSPANASFSAFLHLPRKIRDAIYGFYVAVDGGYRYNFESNKLVRIDGGLTELDLMCVCRQFAADLREVALSYCQLRSERYRVRIFADMGKFGKNAFTMRSITRGPFLVV